MGRWPPPSRPLHPGPLLFLSCCWTPQHTTQTKTMPCAAGLFSTCLLYLLCFYCRHFSGCRNCSQVVHRQLLSTQSTIFFLHGWRRHVCRDCTGHLALAKRELRAKMRNRRKPQAKHQKPNTKQHNQHNPNRPRSKLACSSRRSRRPEKSEG